jgi:hypothetical protein
MYDGRFDCWHWALPTSSLVELVVERGLLSLIPAWPCPKRSSIEGFLNKKNLTVACVARPGWLSRGCGLSRASRCCLTSKWPDGGLFSGGTDHHGCLMPHAAHGSCLVTAAFLARSAPPTASGKTKLALVVADDG